MGFLPPASRQRSSPEAPAVEAELARLTAERGRYSHIFYAVLGLGLTEFSPLGSSMPISRVLAMCLCVLSAARLAYTLRSRKFSAEQHLACRTRFRLVSIACIACFATLCSLPLLDGGVTPVAAIALIIDSGVIAGGITTLAGDLVLARWFSVMGLVPPILLALLAKEVPLGAPASILFFLGFYQFIAKQHYEQSHRAVVQHMLLVKQAQELARASAEAEAATHAKSRFLATISHELRTPLNGVIGMAQLLDDGTLNDRQRECAETLQQSAEVLLGIINDVLDFSKIEADQLELERLSLDPAELLRNVGRVLEHSHRKRGVELLVEVAPDVPLGILGDPTRLKQILLNLGTNALKFTASGAVRLRLDASQAEQPGRVELVFSVSDTGIGMSEEQLATVFQPFRQADVSTTRRYGGTGLGLSISQRLAHLMGAQLLVRSQLGQGSTFTLVLPAELAEPIVTASHRRPVDAAMLSGLRVLVVDDNAVNRKVAQKLLERLGAHTELAGDGVEACELARSRQYDIILMDWMMPVMDGLAATRALRLAHVETPIIAMTANVSEEDRRQCLEAGMNAHLNKPLHAEVLQRVVTEQVRGRFRRADAG